MALHGPDQHKPDTATRDLPPASSRVHAKLSRREIEGGTDTDADPELQTMQFR